MFVYATQILHLSEAEAYLRIAVARASRKRPVLLTMLEDGRLHLSGIALLAPHLTDENCASVLARAVHKSKRRIEELVAELAPKPDVPAMIRKLPTPALPAPPARTVQLRPERVETQARPTPPPPVVEPLRPERYRVQITASGELRDKLERLQALMGEDLAAAIESAVTEKLERLEAKRYAVTKKPRKTIEEADTSPASRYVPAAVRRVVQERDGAQCGFIDDTGRRCTERQNLEFHHLDPFARGGTHDPVRNRSSMPHPQRLSRRAGLRERPDGPVSTSRRSRLGARAFVADTILDGGTAGWSLRSLRSPVGGGFLQPGNGPGVSR